MEMTDSRYKHSKVKYYFWRKMQALPAMTEQVFSHSACTRDYGYVASCFS